MGESFLSAIAESVLQRLESLPHLQDIDLTSEIRNDLKEVKTKLSSIKGVLRDAEDQHAKILRVRSMFRKHPLTYNGDELNELSKVGGDILGDFKKTVYEVEDMVDELEVYPLKQTKNKMMKIKKKYNPLYKFDPKMVLIIQKLDEFAEKISEFLGWARQIESLGREKTYPCILVEEEVFGRDRYIGRMKYDIESIVPMLLDWYSYPVVAVVGMAGIGKTTVARLVCSEWVIKTYFKLTMWVHVYDCIDVNKLMKKILESVSIGNEVDIPEEDLLQTCRRVLEGRKFLLVLDDVWEDNLENWTWLKELLKWGNKGSKVLVTTRSKKVASNMVTDHLASRPIYLGELSEDDCWSLFREHAFRKGQEQEHLKLESIEKEIMKKCGGLPLAAKTIGSLMHSKTEENEWISILRDENWEIALEETGILPSLRLSYDCLPSYLKRCFAYCSLLPANYETDKDTLIQLWIAEGFIHSETEDQCLEDIGNQYFDDLSSKFFHSVKRDECGNIISFTMSSLLHDFAQCISGSHCSLMHADRAEISERGYISESDRHMSLFLSFTPLEIPLIPLPKAKNMRTIYFPFGVWPSVIFPRDDILSHCSFLRVLNLNKSLIKKLPSSIGELKHLRYLDLSWNNMKKLPNSITNLLKLQTLKLLYCYDLKQLPADLGNMTSLRHIEISSTIDFTHMPGRLGKLSSLRTLSAFFVGKDKGCSLSELHELNNLTGSLSIVNIENVRDAEDAKKANLKDKLKIRALELVWSRGVDDHVHNVGKVLKGLQPPPNLRRLHVSGFQGISFPDWMMHSSLFPAQEILRISLHKCSKCENLPPFGKLKKLKVLVLSGLDAVECIDSDFYGVGVFEKGFPSLEEFVLRGMPRLKLWSGIGDEGSFFMLSKLTLIDCPMLTVIPFLPSLREVTMENCSEELLQSIITVENSKKDFRSITSLEIRDCKTLVSLPQEKWQLVHLNRLEIIGCPGLSSLPGRGIGCLKCLQSMRIEGCDSLLSLPEEMMKLGCLRELYISGCPKLSSLPEGVEHLKTLEKLEISRCPQLPIRMKDLLKIFNIPEIIVDESCPSNKASSSSSSSVAIAFNPQ